MDLADYVQIGNRENRVSGRHSNTTEIRGNHNHAYRNWPTGQALLQTTDIAFIYLHSPSANHVPVLPWRGAVYAASSRLSNLFSPRTRCSPNALAPFFWVHPPHGLKPQAKRSAGVLKDRPRTQVWADRRHRSSTVLTGELSRHPARQQKPSGQRSATDSWQASSPEADVEPKSSKQKEGGEGKSHNIVTLVRFVITSGARDLLSDLAIEKQIPRARNPGNRNDNSSRRRTFSFGIVSL